MIEPYSPLVSIAITTHNRANSYLPHTLQSALSQTYTHLEIIVSDDCSTDNTQEFVSAFSDLRIRYFRHAENIGAKNNYNFCVNQARGSYFLLFHDDDLIDPDFVETCMTAVNHETNVGIIRTGVRHIDSQGNIVARKANMVGGLSMEDFILGWFAGKTWPYLSSTLFNTKRLKEIGGFKSKHSLFDDVTAEMVLAARFGRVDVKAIKASTRVHSETRTVSAKVNDWCEDSLELLDLLCELTHDKQPQIRRKGLKFFAWVNYHRARDIRSPFERMVLYYMIFKRFNYQYSPIRFFICRNPYFRKIRRLRNKVKLWGDTLSTISLLTMGRQKRKS